MNNRDAHIARLLNALQDYDTIAKEFITKVNTGQARSTRTYAALTQALERSTKAQIGEISK